MAPRIGRKVYEGCTGALELGGKSGDRRGRCRVDMQADRLDQLLNAGQTYVAPICAGGCHRPRPELVSKITAALHQVPLGAPQGMRIVNQRRVDAAPQRTDAQPMAAGAWAATVTPNLRIQPTVVVVPTDGPLMSNEIFEADPAGGAVKIWTTRFAS